MANTYNNFEDAVADYLKDIRTNTGAIADELRILNKKLDALTGNDTLDQHEG